MFLILSQVANKSKWIGPDVEFHREIFNLNTFAPGADPKRLEKNNTNLYSNR